MVTSPTARVRAETAFGAAVWVGFTLLVPAFGQVAATHSWYAPDRGAKAAALIPGRQVPMPPPERFLADWTKAQAEKWGTSHPAQEPEAAYQAYSQGGDMPDKRLQELLPDHISPFGRLLKGPADPRTAAGIMVSYCPFCGSRSNSQWSFALVDPGNPRHAVTPCCRQDLYEKPEQAPADYRLKPDGVARFQHLDDTVREVPCRQYTDAQGNQWELYPGTVVAYHRYTSMAGLAEQYLNDFRKTGNPLSAHKIAAFLDRVSDVYYGLPVTCDGGGNYAKGRNGQALTRAEWEAFPRPVRYGNVFDPRTDSCTFPYGRRCPLSPGWFFHVGYECRWAEPFAFVRHHPAFKYYSLKRYGDPEALDRKVMTRLVRELGLWFRSYAVSSDYQDGTYHQLMIVAILLGDKYLFDFAAGNQECVLYNHHYHDGLNGEGAPNYMQLMKHLNYYGYMSSPEGWLLFQPDFLKQNPFFGPASTEYDKLYTVRGLPLEWADQHILAFNSGMLRDPDKVRTNEARPSENWPGYGAGVLRVGGPGHRQEMLLMYDRASLHGAADPLGIEYWLDGTPIIRDGGYAWSEYAAWLDRSRLEIQAFFRLPYPRQVIPLRGPESEFECRQFCTANWAHNTATVNEQRSGGNWRDDEGFGDLLTYKGGEAPGAVGARFQVLDCRALDPFRDPPIKMVEFRRALLAVEGPDGRPYAVDVMRLQGGQRLQFFTAAQADPVDEHLPATVSTESNFALYLDRMRGLPTDTLPSRQCYQQLRAVTVLGPEPAQWDLTWRTDYAAYAPLDLSGKRNRPLPDGIGTTRLRLIGLNDNPAVTLVRAKGPWCAQPQQPLPGGASTSNGYVGFRDAWDYVIETASAASGQTAKSSFVHVMEGYREGEQSVIRQVSRLATVAGSASEGVVALRLDFAGGHNDTVIYQPQPGALRFADGLATDAGYALVRRDAKGNVLEADLVRGSQLSAGRFSMRTSGDCRGTIVDLIGDLTGTRQESAVLVKPEAPWPAGTALAGRQIALDTINNHQESYTIERVTPLAAGLLRVDLAKYAPLSMGWYSVLWLDPERPGRLRSNRQLWAGINTTWWHGAKVWFPERGQTFVIRQTGSDRLTMDLVEGTDLKANGIQPGDWFAIYALEPGGKVSVPSELVLRQDPLPTLRATGDMARYTLKATDGAALTLPNSDERLWCRVGSGTWRELKGRLDKAEGTLKVSLSGAEAAGQVVTLLTGKPSWLSLEDAGPPVVTRVLVDGQTIEVKPDMQLGVLSTPTTVVLEAEDAQNPIDPRAVVVILDGRRLGEATRVVQAPGKDRAARVEVSLGSVLAGEPEDRPARHTLRVTVDDVAIDQEQTTVAMAYTRKVKLPENVVYLSDLKESSFFCHNTLFKDGDYASREPLRLGGVPYAKSLLTHTEPAASGAHSEVIYDLPRNPARRWLKSLIGVADSGTGGSVTFEVYVDKGNGWERSYASPVLRGGQEPLGISVDLAGAKRLRLYCTDAGDGIGSDHAAWVLARLE